MIDLPVKEEESRDVPKSNTTVSTMSVGEYFAAKMAALKAKREQGMEEMIVSPLLPIHSTAISNFRCIQSVQVDVDVKNEEAVVKEEITQEETEEERKDRKKKRKEMRKLRESVQYKTPTESCEVKVEIAEEEETQIKIEVCEEEDELEKEGKKKKKDKQFVEETRGAFFGIT
ncbi:unnamed protein product [Strongylus vulgaris]|uniref:Uncharacterized protein n=1 Tax=Strongylus vulgaris TaxID=40348 RepID=A0A3P7LGI9_STRVU|nr:unnamed protein product [Strongylus vulgaris]